MQAIVQDRYGPADVLELREIERPTPSDDEVLLRVQAAGVDPGVWHLMTGLPHLVRIAGFGLRRPKVPIPGLDVAGCVEEVGQRVTRLRPGDSVFGTCEGAFAGYVCAREDRLLSTPGRLDPVHAAALPTSGVTALRGLRDVGRVEPGQQVLIIGAGGGVGHLAVQIATALGAQVTGVCSTGKLDLVRSLGAEQVIDYTREDFADGRRHHDVILDTAGNRPLSQLRRALTPRGTLVIVGGEGGGRWLGGTDRQLRALLLSPFIRQRLRSFVALPRLEDLQALAGLVQAEQLRPVIDRTYPLREAPEAIRYLEQGHTRGKVVIRV